MHFSWLANKQGLRFDSTFIQGNKSGPYTSGMYVWNAAKRKLQIVYTDSSGSLTEGVVTQDENVLVHDLTVTKADATVESVRVRLTKADPNAFTNEIFVFKNKAWSRIVEARYQRYR
jgi:phage-related minor tail protein